jgi:hypothetical protein
MLYKLVLVYNNKESIKDDYVVRFRLMRMVSTARQLRVCNRRDGYFMKKSFYSSARGASFHRKHVSNANVVRAVLLDTNSCLALRCQEFINNP